MWDLADWVSSLEGSFACMQVSPLGQYLYEEVKRRDGYQVVFVWNRSVDKMRGVVQEKLILRDLADCASRYVPHPSDHL